MNLNNSEQLAAMLFSAGIMVWMQRDKHVIFSVHTVEWYIIEILCYAMLMQGCFASAFQTVLLTMNRILKKENTIRGISRNSIRKITDSYKTVNGQFADLRIRKK